MPPTTAIAEDIGEHDAAPFGLLTTTISYDGHGQNHQGIAEAHEHRRSDVLDQKPVLGKLMAGPCLSVMLKARWCCSRGRRR